MEGAGPGARGAAGSPGEETQPRGCFPFSQSLSSTARPGGWSGRKLPALHNTKTRKTSQAGEGPARPGTLGLEQAEVRPWAMWEDRKSVV